MPRKREKRPADTSLAADMLEGGGAIAAFTGISEPRVFYLCERGLLPAFKVGIRWCALKSELRAALTSRTSSEEHGASKVIPSAPQLADVYRLFERGERARRMVDEALAAMSKDEIAAPEDLEERLRAHLIEHPEASWDQAVAALVHRRTEP